MGGNQIRSCDVRKVKERLEIQKQKLEYKREMLQESYDRSSEKWKNTDTGLDQMVKIESLKKAESSLEDSIFHIEEYENVI